SKLPCFSEAEARQIANADQGTDENPATGPGFGGTPEQRFRNSQYHSLHPDNAPGLSTNAKNLSILWDNSIFGNPQVVSVRPFVSYSHQCDLGGLGVYLHSLQDTFSHGGFESDTWGHASALHYNDKTASDLTKSAQMAAATWNALQEWLKQ